MAGVILMQSSFEALRKYGKYCITLNGPALTYDEVAFRETGPWDCGQVSVAKDEPLEPV